MAFYHSIKTISESLQSRVSFSVEHDVNAKTHPLYVQRLDMQGVNNTKGGIRLRPHKRMIGGVNRLNEPHT
jgi:aspartyl aminopeptidase